MKFTEDSIERTVQKDKNVFENMLNKQQGEHMSFQWINYLPYF